MEKHIKYTDLNLKVNKDVKSFTFNDVTVNVLQYLPLDQKYDLMMITLQQSYVDGVYNDLLLDAYFHLALVYMYTDIEFTDQDKADEMALYDALQSSGFIDKFLSALNPSEYDMLHSYIGLFVKLKMKYSTSAANLLSKVIDDLPSNAEAAKTIVDNFDKDKFKEVINFAVAANGGRDLILKTIE